MPVTATNARASDNLALLLADIRKTPIPCHAEQRDLLRRYRNGDIKAKNTLVNGNLRLVFSIAKKYQGRGVDLLDLFQEGVLGLVEAIDRFDATWDTQLVTYAVYWIRNYCLMAIATHSRLIRVPAWLYALEAKWHKASARVRLRENREPTTAEIVAEGGFSESATYHLTQAWKGETLAELHGVAIAVDSPDATDDTYNVNSDVRSLLATLANPRDQLVVALRFGMDGDAMTLREIGEIIGVTKERVRQIEGAALSKLRAAAQRRTHEKATQTAGMDDCDRYHSTG